MFDNLMGPENIADYESKIVQRMEDFDPETDVIAYYGDSVIFALMIMYLSDRFVDFDMARYSAKTRTYAIRTLSLDNFKTAAIAPQPVKRPMLRQALR